MNIVKFETLSPNRVFTIKYYHEGVFLSENLNVIADAQGSVVSPIPDIDMVQGSIDAYLYDDEEEFMFGSTSFYYVDTDAIPVDVYNTFKTKLCKSFVKCFSVLIISFDINLGIKTSGNDLLL